MKKALFTAAAVLFLLLPAGAAIQGSQSEIAKKYADKDQTPVVHFVPESGAALGFIMYAELDGEPGEEIIIPYTVKKGTREIEDRADIAPQALLIDVVKNGKKIRGFIEVDLAYVRKPKVYIHAAKLSDSELPKVFVMVNDGFEKGWDKTFVLAFNSFDSKDAKRQKVYDTVLMPWEFVLKQFGKEPNIVEFSTKLKENHGQFYIRLLDKGAKWPKISKKDLESFRQQLQDYRKEIFWEYGYDTAEEE
ncbi:MAG TPA: hypothetical protein PLB12_12850 [Candidatus Goldiibacteriota bacterium]|nr:hypothetical protein [Candidatus Goldiibacteriota bacterium]HRQ45228.1 hypothetical protein [Candidatus Goldiibacteriota bacterium]